MGCCQSTESDKEGRDSSAYTRTTAHHQAGRRYQNRTGNSSPAPSLNSRIPSHYGATNLHPAVNNGTNNFRFTNNNRNAATTNSHSNATIHPRPGTSNQRKVESNFRPTINNLNDATDNIRTVWNVHELLAETENIDTPSAKNIINLFESENTIPFICRYRRDLIDQSITPDKLRNIKNSYTDIVGLRKKAETIICELEESNDINDEIRRQLLSAKTFKELEFLHSIYKPTSKVKTFGLESYAYRLLTGDSPAVQLNPIVKINNPCLSNVDRVKRGITQIISHQISKNTGVLDELRRLQKVHKMVLKCTKLQTDNVSTLPNSSQKSPKEQSNYEKYFDFENDIRYLRPHQVLAIDRGEKFKFLSVELIAHDNFKICVRSFIKATFMNDGNRYALREEIFERSFEDCYTKKLFPLVCKQVRADLTEAAKKAAIEVFARNLKQLLLKPPLKGERILGIDPGFKHGCKLALISETADVLEVGVVYPHNRRNNSEHCGVKLANMLARHCCKIIALGNGVGCRETESWLSKLFENGLLDPESIHYIIVSERGASVYSCSEMAKEEFPKLDVRLISAVSIARRLNDPLSEYAKIEPRHLGVGMYQHDINENFLSKSLNEVVSECVSYVGVDINTASLSLLKHIAGLNEKRANGIIEYRQKNGPFRSRQDLLKVNSLGEKEFVQCAGFIRIGPKSVGSKMNNILDCTWVHPESYTVATKIIKKCNLELKDIGKPEFISKINIFINANLIENSAKYFGVPPQRLQIVLEALQRKLLQDYRMDFDKKLFKQGITKIKDLFIGEIVTGEVRNIVDFGAFVDIGVEYDALIHKSKMNGKGLSLGDRVTSSVIDIDIPRKRVSLRLDELI